MDISVSVCMSVYLLDRISLKCTSKFHHFLCMLLMAIDRSTCDGLCTSDFVDDVTILYNAANSSSSSSSSSSSTY